MQVIRTNLLPRTAFRADEDFVSAVTVVEEEAGPQFFPASAPRGTVAVTDDETSTSLANFSLLDEPPFVPLVEAIPWYALPFLDDETSSFIYFDDEWQWKPLVETVPWYPLAFLDDETTGFIIYVDDDPPFVPLVESLPWYALVFTDDETTGFIIYVDDEQPWIPLVEGIPWRAFWFTDDEISTNLANFAIEDEQPFIPMVEIVWVPTQPCIEEGDRRVIEFVVDEDNPPLDGITNRTMRIDWNAPLSIDEYWWIPIPQAPPLIPWDHTASNVSKKHERMVADILNSLIRQGRLTQTGASDWTLT